MHGGVSASFSRHVILFEDQYDENPGVTVARRSTLTELSLSVSGGDFGGHYDFEIEGEDKLSKLWGDAFPHSGNVTAGESHSWSITYEAQAESDEAEDIVVTADFSEADGGAQPSVVTKTTVVRLELEAVKTAPENDCENRHTYGVRKLHCTTGRHSGYFDNPDFSDSWSHTGARGAGWYFTVKPGNLWFEDNPLFRGAPQPWSFGTLSWDIPIGWNEIGTERLAPCAAQINSEVTQNFIFSINGDVTMSKFEHWAFRSTNDWRIVDGVTVHGGDE